MEVGEVVDNADGTTTIDFQLNKEEISILMYVGMSEARYNKDLIIPYSEEVATEMLHLNDFKEACADNDAEPEDGFVYLQIGLQNAVIRGINSLIDADKADKQNKDCSCDA